MGTRLIGGMTIGQADERYPRVDSPNQDLTPTEQANARGNIGSPSTFGEKLRRLAKVAEASNPLAIPPMLLPPDWAQSTAYKQGQVRKNANGMWVCAIAGTSAATGTGPSITTDGNVHTDGSGGTAQWTYLGAKYRTTDDTDAPTVSVVTSVPGNFFNSVYIGTKPLAFSTYGGTREANPSASEMVRLTSYQANSAGNKRYPMCRYRFMTDAPIFYIRVSDAQKGWRLIIDGQYYSIDPTFVPVTGTVAFIGVDFSAVGARKVRDISVEADAAGGFFSGVRVTQLDQVWAPEDSDPMKVAFISDSIMAGSPYGPFVVGRDVPMALAKLMGWSDPWSFAQGGTGYINTGGGYYTYGQRITQALATNPDIWIFMGSTNDGGYAAADVTAAALAAFQSIRAGGSKAPIIVFGLWPTAPTTTPTTEDAVAAAVTAFDDPDTYFIPLCRDPVLPWLTGADNNSANTNSLTRVQYLGGDNTHPSDSGTMYLVGRMAASIRKSVLPYL